MSLFRTPTSQAATRNLVEFKAGKMNLRGNMVYPDKRKGLFYLHQGNDMLIHLCWKERTSNRPEDDLTIFPDEIEFKKVTQNTTGRVYVLKWKSNAKKFFIWMQEPKEDKDDEYCKKINDLVNNPPTPSFGDSNSDAHQLQPLMERMLSGGAGGLDPNDLSNVLRGMNPNDFQSLLSSLGNSGAAGLMPRNRRGGESSSTSAQQGTPSSRTNTSAAQTSDSRPNTTSTRTRNAAATPTSTNNATVSSPSATVPTNSTASTGNKSGAIQINTLRNAMANLKNDTTQATETTAASVKSSIPNENLIPLLSNKDVQNKIRTRLPDGHNIPSTEKELRDSIQLPQFQPILDAFNHTLQSGELTSVLSQFDFPAEVTNAANQRDLQAFLQALDKHYRKSSDNTMDTN
ncbi:unnamed protein product [Adineta steineri]|uniref:Proteasomal ubiquitin receptor ADRM1-like protein n=1 Tax=Adineta steineri TaxID=433720 RepID=A0A815MA20_9BILA|nr:unnamed protein product [Adineta steineri]